MLKMLDILRLKSAISSKGITRQQLAKVSGVSRAQLARILCSRDASVRNATLEGFARALGVDSTEILVGGAISGYNQWVERQFAYIDFRGMGLPSLQRQAIEDVFVDVDVVDQQCGEAGNECLTPASFAASKANPQPQVPATEYLASHDRIAVAANPGSGKTTLLRFAAWQAVTDGNQRETPMYVRLPELCRARQLDPRVDLVKFVAARAVVAGCGDVEAALRQELEDEGRHCLVLLDGLDEVGNQEERRLLIDSIQTFVDQYPRNRFVVTSRLVGFEPAVWRDMGFSVIRILPYTEMRLQAFAEKWASIFSRAQGKRKAEVLEALHTAIFSNPRVRALAANPLMLTILVLLNEARGGTLPRRRVDLYEKVVDVFLDTWESNKRSADKFEDTHNIDLDAREFRWLLADLSLAMQKADRTLAPRWWLSERMQQYLQQRLGFESDTAKDACDRILRYLAERTGLIEERGLELFGFSHRTLQEYFASLGVRDEAEASPSRDVTAGLRDYVYHPQWSEVVRLLAAQLTPPLAESLVSSILDDPDPLGRFLHRAPLLAIGCLADGTTVPNRRLVAQAFASLADLGRTRWLGITLRAIDLLEDFEGTRLSDLAKKTQAAILETARQELDKEDCACLWGRVHFKDVLQAASEAIPESFGSEAARQSLVLIDGESYPVVRVNAALLRENPQAWYNSACALLENPAQDMHLKETLIREMGRRIATDRRAGICLRKLLSSAEPSDVRAACATALSASTKGKRPAVRTQLLRTLQRDPDPQVRASCAAALRTAARTDLAVRRQLMELLQCNQSAEIQAGAARGLAGAALTDSPARKVLFETARSDAAPERVRAACAWAVASQIGKSREASEAFKSWLDDPRCQALQRVAAQALARAMAAERLEWDHRVVETIEGILMGLNNPCQCALDSLEELADARAVRHGLRLESVLRDALRSLANRVELAFVFGSTARNRQHAESDIDLFILGDVSLKLLAGPLQQAENTLGRRINPVIHTRESFRIKYTAGDPFLLDVYRREKVPVLLPNGRTSKEDLDDELRTMAAERVAATQ
jgi:transcriptional regulator with XRE-family HTH domain/predicted nucleotidyltransferase